jgi:hypothetical protein
MAHSQHIASRFLLWLIAAMTKRTTQPQDKYVIRMPEGLRERVAKAAKSNNRSMNSEIIDVLEEYYPKEMEIKDLLECIESILDDSIGNHWAPNRKFLTESLKELSERIKNEDFRTYIVQNSDDPNLKGPK